MPRRLLTPCEIAETRLVFGDGLNYSRVHVYENTQFPNLIARIGRSPLPNAVTLGNTSFFPVTLQVTEEGLAGGDCANMSWLIHELTHQWQFQRLGWNYLRRAVFVQLRERSKAYDYQGKFPSREVALREYFAAKRRLFDFNMEQQGDFARDYYLALKQERDPSAWEPFVEEFRRRTTDD